MPSCQFPHFRQNLCTWFLTLLSLWFFAPTVHAIVSGNKRAIVILCSFSSAPIEGTVSEIQGRMFTNAVSVNTLYQEYSYGNVSWSGDVLGPVMINADGNVYNPTLWCDLADSAAVSQGYVISDYTVHVYAFPTAVSAGNYAYAVSAAVGPRVVTFHVHDLFAYGHEVGHSLGMHHASTDEDNNGVLEDEYGDRTDLMGSRSYHPNAPHKIQMGWLPERSTAGNGGWTTIVSNGTYQLSPLESTPNSVPFSQAFKIISPSGDPYIFSYRRPILFDSGFDDVTTGKPGQPTTPLPAPYNAGVNIHRHNGSVVQSRFIDVLSDGGLFIIPESGAEITQVSHDANSVTFAVDLMPGVLGLTGRYYDNSDFTGIKMVRNDSTINFNWGSGGPALGMGVDTFSVRWTGQITAPDSEPYTFSVKGDAGVRLWVNGLLAIDQWSSPQLNEYQSPQIYLNAGQKYDVRLEYLHNSGGAQVHFLWASDHQPKGIIPLSAFSPDELGSGLTGRYYDNSDLTSLKTIRNDPFLDFNWGTSTPVPSVDSDTFSVRWKGKVLPAYSETYTFYTTTDDGVRLWVNGQLLVDKWVNQGATEWSGTIALTAGQKYDIQMEYYDNSVGAQARLAWSSASQPKETISKRRLFPDEPIGTGLLGEYYPSSNFTGTKVVRTDAGVNFDWGAGSPAAGIPVSQFTVRWTGQVMPSYSENYTFYTRTDDGARLWVNGQLVIDKWVNQSATEWSSSSITLVAGQKYDIRMEYFDNGADAIAQLSWSSASQSKQIIPADNLYFSVSNTAPTLAAIGNRAVNEASTLSFSVAATDTDVPAQTLTYSLEPGAPSGVALNTSTGAFTWTPSSLQGPATYTATFRVTDLYGASDAETIFITVNDTQTPTGQGSGLFGEYFDSADLTSKKATHNDARVNFDWGAGSPDFLLDSDSFSARWSGQVQPLYTQTYTFYTRTDDGVRLWVNGQLLIDKWVNQGATEWSGAIALTAGQKYAIVMEYYDNTTGASAKLSWSSSSQVKEVIPQGRLYPANSPPALSEIGNRTVNETTQLSFSATANDADGGQTLAYTLDSGAPTGAAITSAGGFTWTPTTAQGPAIYTVTVRVTDSAGGMDYETLQISVADPNQSYVSGLLAEYYNGKDLTGTKITRTDATVNFNWGGGSPHPALGSDTFSARWTGQVQAGYSEVYTFYTKSDDGVRLWVDGQLLIDHWQNQGGDEWSNTISLVAGQKYDLKMEYFDDTVSASVSLSWSSASQVKQIIPSNRLFYSQGSFTNTPPTLAAVGDRSVNAGSQLTFTASAADPDGNQTLSFSLDPGAPAGASINATTGDFNWTPPGTAGGVTYPVTIRVTDSEDGVDFETIQITVYASETGLIGQYFDNSNFTGSRVTRIDGAVDFDWGTGAPAPGIGVDTFSVRWLGQIQPLYSESYTFYTTTDDGVRLWVNGQLVIDKWFNQSATEWSGAITLTAGQKYDIRMDYFAISGAALARLSWSSASQSKQVIPPGRMWLPSSLAITDQPADNAIYSTTTLSLGGTMHSNAVVVRLSGPGGTVEATLSSAYTWFVTMPLLLGSNAITVTACDSQNAVLQTQNVIVVSTATTGFIDANGNGLPDAWETSTGLSGFTGVSATDDTDSDGRTNLAEYLAGTHPRDGGSFLQLNQTTNGGIMLGFPALAGRTYRIAYRTAIEDSTWTVLQTIPTSGTDHAVNFLDVGAANQSTRFYRLETP